MPVPYAEPASTYLAYQAAYGKGSVPSQEVISTYLQHNNSTNQTLTGTPTSIAAGTLTVNKTTNQVIVFVSVQGNDNGSGCTLIVDVEVDGVSIYPNGPLFQDATGTTHGPSIGFTFAITGLSAGSHTFSLLCSGAGDGTIVVPAHMGNMALILTAT